MISARDTMNPESLKAVKGRGGPKLFLSQHIFCLAGTDSPEAMFLRVLFLFFFLCANAVWTCWWSQALPAPRNVKMASLYHLKKQHSHFISPIFSILWLAEPATENFLQAFLFDTVCRTTHASFSWFSLFFVYFYICLCGWDGGWGKWPHAPWKRRESYRNKIR